MAVPPAQQLPREVIDLTEDDDHIAVPPPPEAPRPTPRHAPLPHVAGQYATRSDVEQDRPAKRLKLAQSAQPPIKPFLRLSQTLRYYAGECIINALQENKLLDPTELENAIGEGLLQKYGTIWPRDDDFSLSEHRDIVTTCKELITRVTAAAAPTQQAIQATSASTPSQLPIVASIETNGSPFPPSSFPCATDVIDLTEDNVVTTDAPPATSSGQQVARPPMSRPPKPEVTQASTTTTRTATPTVSSPRPAPPPRILSREVPPPATPKTVKKARTVQHDAIAHTSPQNFRSRARKAAWNSDLQEEKQDAGNVMHRSSSSSYFSVVYRPYLSAKVKDAILRGSGRLCKLKSALLDKPEIFHVPFRLDETKEVRNAVQALFKNQPKKDDPFKDLSKLLHRLKEPRAPAIASIAAKIAPKISHRRQEALRAFLEDMLERRVPTQELLSLARDVYDKRAEDVRDSRLSSLLLAREASGPRLGLGSTRRLENFSNELRKCLEDSLEIRSEFTNCAGDISTISWVSNEAYIAGTTVHMDSHNQQYNKPGNLVLGSVSRGSATLKAYPDHRIARPLVENGENSTAAMRASQDPWLYTSVVSSDYDPIHDRTYTSGFDRKVKVWSIDESGSSMECIATWEHDGNVNFVQASAFRPTEGTYGFVATAADSPVDAVRIYSVMSNMEAQSGHRSFSCSRILNADDTPVNVDKWAYFPSTMKWGIEESVKHLLLVGYSPRSRTGDDRDIPADRLNKGELCLWDARTGQPVTIASAKTQNVFEVLWHPSQAVFIAATSPIMLKQDANVKTQVRIFSRGDLGQFSELKVLDCMASDINELTIVPNCEKFCYVTAGCTDGKTYVWDTAISDKPVHVLAHGPAVEGVRRNDDEDDTGIKFTAWGTSLDRFYTGSSDGVVKVWNIRTSGKSAKGRAILEAPAQISFGAFSPDKSRLVIGDASGRIFILSVDEEDGKPASFANLVGPESAIRVKRRIPNPITPHPEPLPPHSMDAAPLAGHRLAMLASGQLRYSGDPTVGIVQGPHYAQASNPFFRCDAHEECDPMRPLEAHFAAVQMEQHKMHTSHSQTRSLRILSWDDTQKADLLHQHLHNTHLDLQFENMSLETQHALVSQGIGERELEEGVQFIGVDEDDEAHLREAKCELVREEGGREERLWV